jgi:hypothetical protein
MLRRLWVSLRRDNLINWRNYYYLVTMLVVVVYILTVRFAIPADTDIKADVYVLDTTAEGRFAERLRAQGEGNALVSSEGELRERVQANRNSVGVLVSEGSPLPAVRLLFQGHENANVRNLLAAAMEAELRAAYGQAYPAQVAVEELVLRPGATAVQAPFRDAFVPFLIFSDAVPIALLFIAALVFMEKEEGTLKAILVTPGRAWEYLLSKALTLAFLAVLFTVILVPATLGWGPNYLYLVALVALGSMFSSFLGALVAMFFDNLTQFIWPAILIMAVIGLPGVSYWIPSFSPAWLQWIPTYPLVFGLREASFPAGGEGIVYTALLALAAADLVLLVLASKAFSRQMARS